MRTISSVLLSATCILLFITDSQVFSQTDSLQEKISYYKNNNDIAKQVDAEIELIREFLFYTDRIDEGIENAEKMIVFTKENSLLDRKARLHHILGYALINFKNDFESGLKNFFIALDYYDDHANYKDHSGLLLNLASTYYSYGSYEDALRFCFSGIQLASKEKDERTLADFHNNIGSCYAEMKEEGTALTYWTKAANYFEKINDELSYYEIKINIISLRDPEEVSDEFSSEYIEIYKKAIPLFEENGYINNVMVCKKNMGTHLNKLKKYKKAEDLLLEVLELEKEYPNLETRSAAFFALANIYKNIKRYEQEALYLRLDSDLTDSLFLLGKTQAVAETRTKYQAEKIESENSLLKNKEEMQKTKLENEKLYRYGLFIGLGMIILIAIFVLNRFLASQKQQKIIKSQKGEVDLAYSILETKNNEILDSINYAKRIQAAILPPDKMVKKYLPWSFIFYEPKDIVAGDFYWMETFMPVGANESDQKGILLAAADCTGHGVPGAMVSVVCNNALNRSVREHGLIRPGDILDKTCEIVIKEFEKAEDDVKDGMDIALVSLIPNSDDTWEMEYAGAHNPLWIIRKGSNEIEEIKANKQPIGKFGYAISFNTHKFTLQKGDSFYLFSDGFADQFGGELAKSGGKKLKTKNFKKLLLSIQDKNEKDQKSYLHSFFNNWKNDLEQLDDVCVIGVRL